jgi:hypothetical protein
MDEVLGQSVEQSAPVETSSYVETPKERTFTQSELNDVVKRVKHETEQKVNRLRQEQPEYANQKYGEVSQTQNQSFDEDRYRKIAAEEFEKRRDAYTAEQQAKMESDNAQRVVKNFYDKINAGKEKYEDFDTVTGDIELARFPNVVQLLADHIDNSHDVLYELGKDRLKMAQLEQLSYMSPKDAIIQAQRLAASIRDNEVAGNRKQPNAPLSQQRPSNVGTDSGGVLSMRDLKAKYRA